VNRISFCKQDYENIGYKQPCHLPNNVQLKLCRFLYVVNMWVDAGTRFMMHSVRTLRQGELSSQDKAPKNFKNAESKNEKE